MLGVASVDPVGEVLSTVPGAVPEARALLPLVSSVVEEVEPAGCVPWGLVPLVALPLPAPGLVEAAGPLPPVAEPALPAPLPEPAPLPLPEPPEPPLPPLWAKHTAPQRLATTIRVFVVVVVFFINGLYLGLRVN